MNKTSHTRSILKALSWRALATTDTIILVAIVAIIGGAAVWPAILAGVSVGGLEVMSKLVLYYFHERLWAGVGK